MQMLIDLCDLYTLYGHHLSSLKKQRLELRHTRSPTLSPEAKPAAVKLAVLHSLALLRLHSGGRECSNGSASLPRGQGSSAHQLAGRPSCAFAARSSRQQSQGQGLGQSAKLRSSDGGRWTHCSHLSHGPPGPGLFWLPRKSTFGSSGGPQTTPALGIPGRRCFLSLQLERLVFGSAGIVLRPGTKPWSLGVPASPRWTHGHPSSPRTEAAPGPRLGQVT